MNRDWFLEQLTIKGLSQRKLARHWGVDPSFVTLTLQGKRPMQLDEVVKTAEMLEVSVDEILQNAGLSRH